MAGEAPSQRGRVVMQQCLSARLQVKPPSDTEEAEYVEVSCQKLNMVVNIQDYN